MTDTRTVLQISGSDAFDFLQNLVTNDLNGMSAGLVYAALLTPQGKYLADFFVSRRGEDILLDVSSDLAASLAQRLTMYKLRADVQIADSNLKVAQGLGETPPDALTDPRHPALGWRRYGSVAAPLENWDALRVEHLIPQTGIELVANESYILEMQFERLQGVDFKKGCYVGQEVTARMKHKTQLRKGLTRVQVDGDASLGDDILSGGKSVGTLLTQHGDHALAYLRFDRAKGELSAGNAKIVWSGEPS